MSSDAVTHPSTQPELCLFTGDQWAPLVGWSNLLTVLVILTMSLLQVQREAMNCVVCLLDPWFCFKDVFVK